MADYKLIAKVEERINIRLAAQKNETEDTFAEDFGPPMLLCCVGGMMLTNAIDSKIKAAVKKREDQAKTEMTLYKFVLGHIEKLNEDKYKKQNGAVDEAAFYKDAFIDKTTWSKMKRGVSLPKKDGLLRMVFALRLNEDEARELLTKGISGFNIEDERDWVILALLDVECYDPQDVYDVLEFYADAYSENGERAFRNIYPEMKNTAAKEDKKAIELKKKISSARNK